MRIHLAPSRSAVAAQIPGFCIVRFDTDLLHAGIHLDPPAFQIGIEIGFVAGKLVALEAEIHPLFLITLHDPAVGILALAAPASLAVCLGEECEQLLELRIVLKDREKTAETLGIPVERPEQFLQCSAVIFDFAGCACHTLSAVETAGGKYIQDLLVLHRDSFLLRDQHGLNTPKVLPMSIYYIPCRDGMNSCIPIFLCSFLCLPKETEPKKGHPMKPLLAESIRSLEKFGSRLNSLRFTPLEQNPLFPRIFLHSLTGFRGDPVYGAEIRGGWECF